jgi:hypothetical protein
MPVDLYGHGLLTVGEAGRLKVFEGMLLRRDEMVGSWRKLHNEELHDLYSLPNVIRMIKLRWGGCL